MATVQTARSLDEQAVGTLRSQLRGALLRPGDDLYDATREVWNGMIDKRPALIACCTTTEDVVASVNFARAQGLVIAVRGGGHSVAGNGVCDDGLMIDLTPMKRIDVDPVAKTVRAQAGVLWQEFDAATQTHGLATTGGAVSTTGIAGLTLGGGLGFLMRRLGTASDNLLSAEIVTADGQVLHVSADEHADLFWGIRGGGGNFGVVTTFEYQLHEVGPTVIGGMVLHPIEQAREALRFYRDFCSTAPDELEFIPGMLTGPDGTRLIALIVCYSGSPDAGERVVAPIRAFGRPVADLIAPMHYTAVQQLFDPAYPHGRRNYWKAGYADELSDAAIDTMVEWFDKVTSPFSAIEIELLGGAIGRLDENATAYSHRDASYNVIATTSWTDPAEDDTHIGWARGFWRAMQPFVRQGSYVNYLSVGEQDRVRAAYGDKYDRLVALKSKYDPTNLFRMNQNIRPSSP